MHPRKPFLRLPLAAALLLAVVACGAAWSHSASPERRHINAGIEFAAQKQGRKAEQEWRQAVVANLNSIEAWTYLSEYYADIQSWRLAVEAEQQLARIQPNTPHLYARLAEHSLKSGDERGAYLFSEESLKRDPDDVISLGILNAMLQRTGEIKRRIDVMRRLCRLQPENQSVRLQLAEEFVSVELYPDARIVVDEILLRTPNEFEALSLRGVITAATDASREGLDRAVTDLVRSEQDERFVPFAQFHLGKIYKRQGKSANAISNLLAASTSMPNKPEVFFELSDAYARAGQPQAAARARRQFESLRPSSTVHSIKP